MRWQRRDVKIASRCSEVSFSLTGEDEAECIEGVETIKYLRQMIYRLDNDWRAFRRNVSKKRQVWSRIGKILQREVTDLLVSEIFYWAVVQAVLIFGEEYWVFLVAMSKNL